MGLLFETGYLETPYLSGYGYLTGQRGYFEGIQVNQLIVANLNPNGFQVQGVIEDAEIVGFQTLMKVDTIEPIGFQTAMYIVDYLNAVGFQTEMIIKDESMIGFQVRAIINDEALVGQQASAYILDSLKASGFEVNMIIKNDKVIGFQVEGLLKDETSIGQQVEMFIVDEADDKHVGMHVEMSILDELSAHGMQAKIFPYAQWLCAKYLNSAPYLTDAYLSPCIRAFLGMQASMQIIDEADDIYLGAQVDQVIETSKAVGVQAELSIVDYLKTVGMQVESIIFDFNQNGMQSELIIKDSKPNGLQVLMQIQDYLSEIGQQVNRVKANKVGFQSTMVIYNITQLRILCDFVSRGVPSKFGNTWASLQPIRTGDFSPNNLNTDTLEERTETDGITALWELRNDNGILQGAFIDTVAILDHNFTSSARVTFQGTNDPTFGTINQSIVMVTEKENMYYIAPTLPTVPSRYTRFLIEDLNNPDGYLRIGVIVFGASNIFTLRERFVNPVTYGRKHFKDTIETEGYSNVSNDRAIRKFLTLDFEQLNYAGGNYRLLEDYFSDAKTDLKCLIIPRPTRPSSLAVFSKLMELPSESHYAISDENHYVSLTLNWDESL